MKYLVILSIFFIANNPIIAQTCWFQADPRPNGAGYVTGNGTYPCGTMITVVATPYEGYHFVKWTNYNQTISYGSNPVWNCNVSACGNYNYIALFEQISYSVTLSSLPQNGGTTTGSGGYLYGATVTISATPKSGYTFTGWQENGNLISTSSSYTFTINSSRIFIAVFTQITQCTLALSPVPADGGVVSGGGSFQINTLVTINATANYGFTFFSWSNGTNILSTSPNYTFNITENTSLTANFNIIIPVVLIANVSPSDGGYTTGGGQYDAGQTAIAVAHANTGWKFVNWTEFGSQLSTDTAASLVMNSDRTVTANFQHSNAINETVIGELLIFPNPSKGKIFVRVDEKSAPLSGCEIFSVDGRKMYSRQNINLHFFEINTSDFQPGVYSLRMIILENIIIKKFVALQ